MRVQSNYLLILQMLISITNPLCFYCSLLALYSLTLVYLDRSRYLAISQSSTSHATLCLDSNDTSDQAGRCLYEWPQDIITCHQKSHFRYYDSRD